MKRYAFYLLGIPLLCASPLLHALSVGGEAECGSLQNAYGPFDYTNPTHFANNLSVVEGHHFTPEVEALVAGKTTAIGGDIDYTLRAFPNHHRALKAMTLLGLKEKTDKPKGAHHSVECYFDRALRFKPNDPMVHLTYSYYFYKHGKLDKAIEQAKAAEQISPDNANVNYNLGLLYAEKKNYAEARAHARKAYERGFPLPGLKNKLIKAGQWEGK